MFAIALLQGRISLRCERKHAQRKLEVFRVQKEKKTDLVWCGLGDIEEYPGKKNGDYLSRRNFAFIKTKRGFYL